MEKMKVLITKDWGGKESTVMCSVLASYGQNALVYVPKVRSGQLGGYIRVAKFTDTSNDTLITHDFELVFLKKESILSLIGKLEEISKVVD